VTYFIPPASLGFGVLMIFAIPCTITGKLAGKLSGKLSGKIRGIVLQISDA